jgi:hypothetical protein
MSNRTHASTVDNDGILQRLDHEHLVAHEKASRLMESDNEADVGESAATKAAWLAFDPVGYAAASFPATSLEGIKSKTRILARQGRGLSAGEIIEGNGDDLKRLAASVLHDALELYGADYAEPDSEAASENP